MSGNLWNTAGIPHKGWWCVEVIDLRADGTPSEETDYAVCQMCGNERIRFVHVMAHPDLSERFDVGCVCAEKMSDDYEGPKKKESRLRNRAVRRARWLQRAWRISAKGNSFLNLENYNLVVYPTKTQRWGYKIGDRFSQKTYETVNEAKLALFDDFWSVTQENESMWSSD